MTNISVISSKLVEYVARLAVGLSVDESDLRRITGSVLYPIVREAVNRVASEIVIVRNGLLRCNICGRGPFTRRGLYLHLIRVHRYDIMGYVEDEYNKIVKIIGLNKKY